MKSRSAPDRLWSVSAKAGWTTIRLLAFVRLSGTSPEQTSRTDPAAPRPCPLPAGSARLNRSNSCGTHEDRPDALGDETRDTGPPSGISLGKCVDTIDQQHGKAMLLKGCYKAAKIHCASWTARLTCSPREPCPKMSHSDLRARLSEVTSSASRAYVGRST